MDLLHLETLAFCSQSLFLITIQITIGQKVSTKLLQGNYTQYTQIRVTMLIKILQGQGTQCVFVSFSAGDGAKVWGLGAIYLCLWKERVE
jgi:hypothetical protein